MIARLQTPRNRELGNLIVVALLVVTGFGAVFIARENAVSTASLTYAAFFVGLYLIAHIVLRIALPNPVDDQGKAAYRALAQAMPFNPRASLGV